MKKSRSDLLAFNPEKFLATEKKRHRVTTGGISLGRLVPLQFSKERMQIFLERLLVEAPAAFYFGNDPTTMDTALQTLNAELAKELRDCGIAADPVLVQALLTGVMLNARWRREGRKRSGGKL